MLTNGAIPDLSNDRAACCGCGACKNACPVGAITMREDVFGFFYPVIVQDKCIRCGKCEKVCAFRQGNEKNTPLQVFAAQRDDMEALKLSASGGVFAALAEQVLSNGGIVYGAAMDETWTIKHTAAHTPAELTVLLGSKYSQSHTGDTFHQVKEQLSARKQVLYCGTPCQIAGLYGYLGGDREGLLTADLICHGVPSNRMLRDYLALLQKQLGGTIRNFTFRDKSIGWGINGSVTLHKNGVTRKEVLWQSSSAYLYYFSQGWLYRDSCYQCPYASSHRPADITLGDYWGFETVHPELCKQLQERAGISLVIANTAKGKAAISDMQGVCLHESSFEKACSFNHQLSHPSVPGKRDQILDIYRHQGWDGVDKRFQSTIGWHKYTSQLKHLLPAGLKRWLKQHR